MRNVKNGSGAGEAWNERIELTFESGFGLRRTVVLAEDLAGARLTTGFLVTFFAVATELSFIA